MVNISYLVDLLSFQPPELTVNDLHRVLLPHYGRIGLVNSNLGSRHDEPFSWRAFAVSSHIPKDQ